MKIINYVQFAYPQCTSKILVLQCQLCHGSPLATRPVWLTPRQFGASLDLDASDLGVQFHCIAVSTVGLQLQCHCGYLVYGTYNELVPGV